MEPLQSLIGAMEKQDKRKVMRTEMSVRDLSNSVEDLTDWAKSGISMNTIKACRQELIEAQRKLNDLLRDSQ